MANTLLGLPIGYLWLEREQVCLLYSQGSLGVYNFSSDYLMVVNRINFYMSIGGNKKPLVTRELFYQKTGKVSWVWQVVSCLGMGWAASLTSYKWKARGRG